jgi:hypothetical protein
MTNPSQKFELFIDSYEIKRLPQTFRGRDLDSWRKLLGDRRNSVTKNKGDDYCSLIRYNILQSLLVQIAALLGRVYQW